MNLISIQGWDTLLYINVDSLEHVWLSPSKVEKGELTLPMYSLEALLTEWFPPTHLRRH